MNESDVIRLANQDDIAGPGMDLKAFLRSESEPAFFLDAGNTSWRRKVASMTIAEHVNYVALPDDCFEPQKIWIGPDYGEDSALDYIGDFDDKVIAAVVANDGADYSKPTGWYVEYTEGQYQVRFNCPADQEYDCVSRYLCGIPASDYDADLNLSSYIPPQFQWGLVEKLKAVISRERYGIGDQRTTAADAAYQQWWARVRKNPQLAPSQKIVSVR